MDLENRVGRVEKRLDATTKLLYAGMKMLVNFQKENRQAHKETREAIQALIDSHLRLDAKVNRLVDSMLRRGSNGG